MHGIKHTCVPMGIIFYDLIIIYCRLTICIALILFLIVPMCAMRLTNLSMRQMPKANRNNIAHMKLSNALDELFFLFFLVFTVIYLWKAIKLFIVSKKQKSCKGITSVKWNFSRRRAKQFSARFFFIVLFIAINLFHCARHFNLI